MKIRIIISAVLLFCMTAFTVSSSGYSHKGAIQTMMSVSTSAESCVVYCLDTDEMVYSSNENKKLPMASTTKMMTAIIVIESTELDDIVKVPNEAVGVEGSSAYLMKGEKITVKDLLYALLLESANDAAVALAVHTSGDVDSFVSAMNDKAVDIGMHNTRYTNPHGLDDSQHYSTALDMALLCDYAMENESFCEITGSYRYETQQRLFINHNRLLKSCDGVIGGKTGFTKRSGRCLVSVAKRQGVTMCIVTLNDPNDWQDHAALYDASFDIYETVDFEGADYTIPVINGQTSAVDVCACGTSVVIKTENADRVQVNVLHDRFLYAPVDKGECVGYLVYSCDGHEIARTELIAKESINIIKKKTLIERIVSLIFQD